MTAGRARRPLVLGEEADVVVEERLDRLDALAQHQHALEAEAEREPGVLLGVDADLQEHVRVDHPAATELDPTRLRADATARTVTEDAGDRELGRRLGEREERREQAGLQRLAEVRADESLERS